MSALPEGYVFGRPTDYKPEFCEQLIKHCSEGLSFESFAGKILVTRKTLYNWRESHEDFLHAAEVAKEKCREYWEGKGRDGTVGELDKFNSGSWQFIMKNFFRDEWSETVKQEVTGKDGERLQTVVYLPSNGRDNQD